MQFGILLIATAFAALMTAACSTAPNSVAAASQAPIPTTVGPVPGGVSDVNLADESLCRRSGGSAGWTAAFQLVQLLRLSRWPCRRRHGTKPSRRGVDLRQSRRPDL